MRSRPWFTGAVTFALTVTFWLTASLAAWPGPPIVTEFAPTQSLPGRSIELHGTNLFSATAVEFSGVPALFSNAGITFLWVVVPEGAVTGPITVRNPEGSYTTTESFTVLEYQPPLIKTFSPLSGPPETWVQLEGDNLTDVISVDFNGIVATGGYSLGDVYMAQVPTNAVTGPITIRTKGGTHSTIQDFEVLPAVPSSCDLSVLIQAPAHELIAPDQIEYIVTIANESPEPASGVVLHSKLFLSPSCVSDPWSPPDEIRFPTDVSATVEGGKCTVDQGKILAEIGELPASGTVAIHIVARSPDRGLDYLLAEVEASQDDPRPENNRAVSVLRVRHPNELWIERKWDPIGTVWINTIRWPSVSEGYVLQSTDRLPDGTWKTVETNPSSTNGIFQVVVSPSESGRFYRLSLP